MDQEEVGQPKMVHCTFNSTITKEKQLQVKNALLSDKHKAYIDPRLNSLL